MTRCQSLSRRSSGQSLSHRSSGVVRPCPTRGFDRRRRTRPAWDPQRGVPGRGDRAACIVTGVSRKKKTANVYDGLHDRRAAGSPQATWALKDMPTGLPTDGER